MMAYVFLMTNYIAPPKMPSLTTRGYVVFPVFPYYSAA